MVLTIISISIFLIYLGFTFGIFKRIPKSLSDTYYMYKEKKEWLKFLFPIMIFCVSGLLLPAWLDATEGSTLQFLSFLTCASIMFVGASPNFKNVGIESKIHVISAIISAICAIAWCIFVTHTWYVILLCLIVMVILAFITKTLKTSYVFWLEMVAFSSLFVSLLFYEICSFLS